MVAFTYQVFTSIKVIIILYFLGLCVMGIITTCHIFIKASSKVFLIIIRIKVFLIVIGIKVYLIVGIILVVFSTFFW